MTTFQRLTPHMPLRACQRLEPSYAFINEGLPAPHTVSYACSAGIHADRAHRVRYDGSLDFKGLPAPHTLYACSAGIHADRAHRVRYDGSLDFKGLPAPHTLYACSAGIHADRAHRVRYEGSTSCARRRESNSTSRPCSGAMSVWLAADAGPEPWLPPTTAAALRLNSAAAAAAAGEGEEPSEWWWMRSSPPSRASSQGDAFK